MVFLPRRTVPISGLQSYRHMCTSLGTCANMRLRM
eukprot:jgi/Antlo1/817/1787